MRGASHRRGEGAFGAIVSIIVLILAGIALVKIVPLHIAGNAVYDAMSEQANFGGLKTFDKLAYEVYVKASEAGVPLPLNEIKVRKHGNDVIIEAKYEQTVTVLGFKYTYRFDRSVQKPTF